MKIGQRERDKARERETKTERERLGSDASFPLFEIFNECLCSLEILTFSHIARGDRWERRLFPHSNKKQKAVSIKLLSVFLLFIYLLFSFLIFMIKKNMILALDLNVADNER